MINKISKLLLLLTLSYAAPAQFFYKDIISNKQATAEMALLKEQKIRMVKVNSFENDGQPSNGFFCEKKIAKNYDRMQTFSKSNITGISLFTAYYNNGILYKTVDSSKISVSTSTYLYNSNNTISHITSIIKSNDDDFANEVKEEHIYFYDSDGWLTQMKKVKNNKDTTLILFLLDENNNVAIEKDSKTGSKYYYYYDTKNQLTDIVHSNDFKQNLVPDYVFEYNNNGQIAQMINTEEGGNFYFIWKYLYDNGLRIKEKCYSKDKKLMGSIEYEYK